MNAAIRLNAILLLVLVVDHCLAAPEASRKPPVPPESELARAGRLIAEIFGDQQAKADTLQAKQELARKMLETAMSEQDLAGKYVLLKAAREFATEGLDGPTSFAAIEAMAAAFEIDAIAMKTDVLIKGAAAAKTPEQHLRMTQPALRLVELAIVQEDFAAAKRLCDLALSEAVNAGNKPLAAEIGDRILEVTECGRLCDGAKPALAALKAAPLDPDANQHAGMYYCFGKGDWDRGVPMLALGSDSLLKSVARKELLEDCSSVADQVSLGDAWYDLAQTKTGFAKSAIHRRAIHWYCRALPSLTGLTRDKVDGRLRRMEGGAQPSAAPVAETPQPTIPVPAPPPVLPKQPAQAIRPGYSLVWQGRNGQYVEARDVGARSWVDVDLRAHGFEQASQAKAILDLQTPKVIRKVQANNPQVRLVVKRQYDTKAGEVFIRNIRLGADN